jgi:lipid-A-disaccharide synthase
MNNERKTFSNTPASTSQSHRTLMIVTGEASGDLHGAELARALWKLDRSLEILGMGGQRMEKAGVELVFDNRRLGVMGLVEVIKRWRWVARSYYSIRAWLKKGAIDLLVLIDSPDFNLRIARVARRYGIPVVYYIGPKIWAWRSGRVRTIAKRIQRMLVILPFEEEIYRKANVSCKFVGNPLLDEMPNDLDRKVLRRQYGLDPCSLVVALLPGSRRQEIKRILPVMLSASSQISKEVEGVNFVLPVAPSVEWQSVECETSRWPISIKLVPADAPRVLASADAAVVASGTATLEAALTGTPMVIVYKMAWLTYILARMFIRVRNIGLVNIVAGHRIVPELVQGAATGKTIANELVRLLKEKDLRQEMKKALERVSQRIGPPGASMRAAEEVLTLLHKTGVSGEYGTTSKTAKLS